MKTEGTPKTLFEAIERGIDNHFGTDAKVIHANVRDYLAQRFTIGNLRTHKKPLTVDDLQLLFSECVNENSALAKMCTCEATDNVDIKGNCMECGKPYGR